MATDYSIAGSSGTTGLSQLAEPLALGDKLPLVNVSDTATPPAGSAGSDQYMTAATAASAFSSLAGDKVSAQLLGADPTGSVAIDSVIASIMSGAPAGGVKIFLGEGTFKISTGLALLAAGSQTIELVGAAPMSTTLDYHGSGDAVHLYNNSAQGSGGAKSYYSGVRDLTIDGTNATGSPVGLHMGDITFLRTSGLIIQNFTGTSSIGLHLDNATTWTEQGDHRAVLSNCTRGVVLEVTTGFNSFAYNRFDLTFFQSGAQSCFCLVNGAFFYHGSLFARGDVNGSSSALTGNPAAISVAGLAPVGTPDAGGNPGIVACHLDVLLEPNNLSGTATHFMSTFYLDNATSFGFISECYGLLDYSQGTGTFTPISTAMLPGNGNNFTSFSGVIAGDSNLNPSGVTGWNVWGSGSIKNYLPSYTGFDGFFPTQFADTFNTTLDGSDPTFALNFSGIGNGDTLPGPQEKAMYIRQPASGGPFTLGFTVAGSGTVAAPTIRWASGVNPVLNPLANALDLVAVSSWDGAVWDGRRLASYGTATAQVVSLRPEALRVRLTTAFTSASSISAQDITGLGIQLLPGTYKLTAWVPLKQASGTTATVHLGATFGGTATSAEGKWLMSSGTTQSLQVITAVTTSGPASPTLTAALQMLAELSCQVVVSAAGTLQLQVTASATGNTVTIPVGAYIDIEPVG